MRPDYYFPEEIIFMILSWLPVMSLLRFRSVCKSWRSMISSPKLIDTHLTNSQKKQANVLWLSKYDAALYIKTPDASVTLHLPPQFSGMKHFIRSCNGLVCLSNRHGDIIYLWNPLTKQFKKLPTPTIKVNFPQLDIGFCFDSISNDYKLLRIVWSDLSHDGYFTLVLEAELYSTNTNSWKEIQLPKTVQDSFQLTHYDSKCVSKTGVLYIDGDNKLLSFDSHNEVFGVYPFPNPVHLKRKSDILDYEGFVAIILESVIEKSVFSLWTLDNVCGKVSWIKKFNLEIDPGFCDVTLYLGVGQYVARNYHARYVCYDSTKKENKKLPFTPPIRGIGDLLSVIKYNDSLFSLEGFEQLDYRVSWRTSNQAQPDKCVYCDVCLF